MEIFDLCKKKTGVSTYVKMIRSHWYKKSIIILLAGDFLSACTKDFHEQGLGISVFQCSIMLPHPDVL